jgi:hypothetical protein
LKEGELPSLEAGIFTKVALSDKQTFYDLMNK